MDAQLHVAKTVGRVSCSSQARGRQRDVNKMRLVSSGTVCLSVSIHVCVCVCVWLSYCVVHRHSQTNSHPNSYRPGRQS